MKIKFTIQVAFFLLSISIADAQNGFSSSNATSCGTTEIMNLLFQKNPKYRELNQQIEQHLLNYYRSGQKVSKTQSVITLPVVVHIIHNNGSENVSDATVLAGIQHLNEAFANTGYYNPADGVNTNIQFCMAQRDPGGNVTNGITRNVSTYTNMGGPYYYSDDQNVKNINRWNPNCYINIWLVNSIPGSVAGYAYMPGAHGSNVDGILAEAGFFGSSYSSDVVIIHEMGHYLGLYHTFEGGCTNGDCLQDGDKICDTPPDNSTAFTPCGIPVNSCNTDTQSGFSTDQNDLTQDYMDYGNWGCMTVFTQGQADRMNGIITNVRSSLLNCRSCLPPCPAPVTANFNSSATNVTAGTTVNFANTSTNGVTYNWYINNVFQSAAFNFSNTFNTPGIYIVKLVAAGNNTTLCDSSAREETITVTCPVAAGFTSSAVEIPIGQSINFTNTSTGSPVSNAWYIDNVLMSTTVNFSNQFNQSGTFTIKLTVGSGICTSSKSITVDVTAPCSTNSYFEKMISSPTMGLTPKHTIVASDSSIIILGGSATLSAPYTEVLTVMKLSKNGNILWARGYYGPLRFSPEKIMQLSDGNFIVSGLHAFGSLDYKPFLMKINGNGQVLWEKSYAKTGITNFYTTGKFELVETPSHDIILGATMERAGGETRTYLLKFDAAGTLIWSKEANGISNVQYFALKNNSLYASFGSAFIGAYVQITMHLAKVNITDGSVVFAKKYNMPPPLVNSYAQILRFNSMRVYNDELRFHGSISAGSGHQDTGAHLIVRMDTLGVIQDLKRIRFTDPQLFITANLPGYYRKGLALNNGDYAFFEYGESPYFPWPRKIFMHHTDLATTNTSTKQIMRGIRPNFQASPMSYSQNDNIMEKGNNNIVITTTAYDSAQSSNGLLVYSSDYSGVVSASCPTPSGTHTYYSNIILTNNAPELTLTDAPFTTNASVTILDSAIQYNSYSLCSANNPVSCFSVKIDAPDTLCITQDSVLISCHRNPGCTEIINWSISSPAQNTFRQINDTTIKVLFNNYGNYSVVATLGSCSSISDTAYLFIARNAALLSLGPDKTICTFSTSVLNAGSGYKTYNWYNGTADSITTIYDPGMYYVTVQDYCNNISSDTIKFTLVNSPAFNLGPDTTICSLDSLIINAPAGFSSYTWASNYNITSTSGQSVRVWPAIDTVYTVTALFNNGCSVLDSIKVSVKTAIPINLGIDTSFCQGGSVFLNAGAGFNSYLWNTGAATQGITVSTAGIYSVAATNSSGCISKDTLKVLNVYQNPLVNLGADANICQNAPLSLNAGSGYSNYSWQDNSHSQFFLANVAGTYWVTVSSAGGCRGSDTINILRVLDTPRNFIQPIIEICNNNNWEYTKANDNYTAYLWSGGSTRDSILITQPGNYWLQVTNSFGCKAKENFTIVGKSCLSGVYFPNSFTPNNDSKNDHFKALVYEDLEYFELAVFNRYGQQIFSTKNYNIGWDGTFMGVKQGSGVFVWFCTYKLKNTGVMKNQKGTILLLR
jgi:gliding motility-associated-like protein